VEHDPREGAKEGYELSKGRYVEIDDNELQAIEIESTHTVDIDSFVPRAETDAAILQFVMQRAVQNR
jgi:DNA end-binding protein Ku